jgi:hypothetical protein
MAAQRHLGILPAFDPRLRGGRLLRQTCRMVPFMFSMMFVCRDSVIEEVQRFVTVAQNRC